MCQSAEVEALVVGAGVVGLATAACLGQKLSRVVVLERHSTFGEEVSSRSSEVVHGGLYYEPSSLKADLCIEGAALTYERSERLGVPLLRRGKLVLATTPDQTDELNRVFERATACGARDLELWSRDRLAREEPLLEVEAALLSPWTGVVDSYELVRSFAVEAKDRGVDIAYRHELVGLESHRSGWLARAVDPTGETTSLSARIVINAAGLGADKVAAMAGIDVDEAGYRIHPCKGDYFSVRRSAVRGISRLLYPLPEPQVRGLGIHLTIDQAGQARLGPDAEYLPAGYADGLDVDPAKATRFLAAGRKLLKWLEPDDIAPERSGIRPKLAGPGEAPRDFVIRHEGDRGLDGLVSLAGIESPGLTAAPAIARRVVRILEDAGLI